MTQPTALSMRPATMADVHRIVEIHAVAFHRTFMAAFGRKRYEDGLRVMAEVWRRQGSAGLHGMWVAEHDGLVVGTITMRTRGAHWLPASVPVEWLFVRALGVVRGMYALHALSFIEYHVAHDDLYITDVAVDERFQRQGVGRAMLAHAVAYAERQHLCTVSLYVDAANVAACSLYLGSGFVVERTHYSLMGWILLRQSRWLLLRRCVSSVAMNEHVSIRS